MRAGHISTNLRNVTGQVNSCRSSVRSEDVERKRRSEAGHDRISRYMSRAVAVTRKRAFIGSDEAKDGKIQFSSSNEHNPFQQGHMTLPHPRERIMTDCLDRMFLSSAGIKWISRFCVLTKDRLTFAKLHHADKASQWVQRADLQTMSKENLREIFQRHDIDQSG